MNNFQEMSKGLMDWHEKYNSDMGGIYSEMAATKSNGVLNTYIHSKEGTVHSLTGDGAIMRFFTSAPWEAGDTITVNGEAVEPKTLDGQALPSGAFVTGMWAVAVKDGATLQFLTQSYAGAFADIQTQLSNKVNVTLLRNKGLLNYGAEVPDNDCDKAISFGCYMIRPETLNAYREKQADDFEVMLTMAWNEGTIAQLTVAPNSEGVGFRSTQIGTGKWLPWKQLATAEPPQKYELPLSEGVSVHISAYYTKNQFGEVTVVASLTKEGGLKAGDHLFVMPEGFRPSTAIEFPIVGFPHVPGLLRLQPDGTAYIQGLSSITAETIFMNLYYLAD